MMKEDAGSTPSELSASSLLTGIGKLVFDISTQTSAIAEKVETLEQLVSTGMFERLDRIVQGIEALQGAIATIPAAIPAQSTVVPAPAAQAEGVGTAGAAPPAVAFPIESLTAPIEAGVARLASLETRVESIEKAVAESVGSIGGIAAPIVAKLESIEGKADSIGAAIEGSTERMTGVAGTEGEAVRRILSEQDARLTGLLEAVTQIGKSTLEVSGTASALTGRIENLDKSVSGMPELLGRKMSESSSAGIAPVQAAIAGLGEDLLSIQPAVKSLEETLVTKVSEFETRTSGAIGALGATVENQRTLLDDMRITLGEAAQGQEKSLSDMAGLLRTHRDAVNRSRVDDLNNEAIDSFNRGRLEEAAASLKSALEIDPERAELLANLGNVQAASGAMKESEESFKKALAKDPYLEPALSGLGLLYIRTGRPRDTLDILARFIEDPAPSSRIALACSRAMAAMERHSEAIALIQRALSADPGNPDLESELASYKADS